MKRLAYAVVCAFVLVGFTCRKPCVNLPPETPQAPAGSAIGYLDSSCVFSAFAVDPDTDSVAIRFDWGNGDTSYWSGWVTCDSPVEMSKSWSAVDTYLVRVQAKDRLEAESDWSAALKVTITLPGNRAPETPETPVAPGSGRSDSTYLVSARSTDPDGDSVSIRFAWGDGTVSLWSDFVPGGEDIAMPKCWGKHGTYYVKAQARDCHYLESDWSAACTVRLAIAPGEVLWWFEEPGEEVFESPAIGSDGTIYVGGYYHLYAIDPDGTLKWRYEARGGWGCSPAIGPDGTVYIQSEDGYLHALRPNGTLKWRCEVDACLASSPAIGKDGTIYVGPYGSGLCAVSPDGTLKWRYPDQEEIGVVSPPAVSTDGAIYAGFDEGGLYAINPDGTLKWCYPTEDRVESPLAIGPDGTIYAGSDDFYLYAINPDGTLKWCYLTGGEILAGTAIGSDGTIYVGSGDGFLYAISSDGTLKWRYETGDQVESSPAIDSDGTIYVGSGDGCLYAINPDGTSKWCCPTERWVESSPSIGPDGTVYIGTEDGYLYAIGGSAPLADSPWPKFQHDNQNTGRAGSSR